MRKSEFRVGITRDCLAGGAAERPIFDPAVLRILDASAAISWDYVAHPVLQITPEQSAAYDALVLLRPDVTRASFAAGSRLKLLARLGVGYDNIDLDACTAAGVMLTITPDGVRRPVATAILGFILALGQKLNEKQRIARTGVWSERLQHIGSGLTGKIVGSIGFGNIAQEMFLLLRPLDMIGIAHSPRADPAQAAALGVRLADFATVLREADFLCINCPLTPQTLHLLDAQAIAQMKPSAFLINTARGRIVDQAALYRALVEQRIAGAALDVFEQEPAPAETPLLALENVIVTPHAICWTEECFRQMAESACRAVVDVAEGRIPAHVVNRHVLQAARQA